MAHIWEPDNRALKDGDFRGQLAPPLRTALSKSGTEMAGWNLKFNKLTKKRAKILTTRREKEACEAFITEYLLPLLQDAPISTPRDVYSTQAF